MVKLKVIGSVLGKKDKERCEAWERIFKRSLEKRMPNSKFVCVSRKCMFGCFIMLFAKQEHEQFITNIHTKKLATGASGFAENKGSTTLRFDFMDTGFFFLNCHLTSG
jgi:hypothetical protein